MLSLALGAWLAVKYCLLFEIAVPTHAARVASIISIMLVVMLCAELTGCHCDWAFNVVYIFLGAIPLICRKDQTSVFGELAVVAFSFRLMANGCTVLAAVCVTATLVFSAYF